MGATGIAEGKILFLSLFDLTWVLIGMPDLCSRPAMSITGLGIFSFAISLLPTQSIFITKPVSIVIYCGVHLLFRDFREQELVAVISLVRKGGEID